MLSSVSGIKLQIIDHKADARPSVKVLCEAATPRCPQNWETKWKKSEAVSHHILKRPENWGFFSADMLHSFWYGTYLITLRHIFILIDDNYSCLSVFTVQKKYNYIFTEQFRCIHLEPVRERQDLAVTVVIIVFLHLFFYICGD